VIAQISDVHIGGRVAGGGERFSEAVRAIDELGRRPDLVLVTGAMTESGTAEEWDEFLARLAPLRSGSTRTCPPHPTARPRSRARPGRDRRAADDRPARLRR
jgi:3',5'-cyclic AMP phosphodiesterase CpdA